MTKGRMFRVVAALATCAVGAGWLDAGGITAINSAGRPGPAGESMETESMHPAQPVQPDSNPVLLAARGRVLFEEDFASLHNWRHEGGGRVLLDSELASTLKIECIGSQQGGVGTQMFCLTDFPDSIMVEYDLKVLTKNGLVITFIGMKGARGEDIFGDGMPLREGRFDEYVRNPRLVSYHVSVSRYDDDGRHTGVSNWRRSPGLVLMGQGPDLCREINRWYRIQIVKNGTHLQLGVNGQLAHEFRDPGDLESPVPDGGKVGFRAIGSDVRALVRNFRVVSLR